MQTFRKVSLDPFTNFMKGLKYIDFHLPTLFFNLIFYVLFFLCFYFQKSKNLYVIIIFTSIIYISFLTLYQMDFGGVDSIHRLLDNSIGFMDFEHFVNQKPKVIIKVNYQKFEEQMEGNSDGELYGTGLYRKVTLVERIDEYHFENFETQVNALDTNLYNFPVLVNVTTDNIFISEDVRINYLNSFLRQSEQKSTYNSGYTYEIKNGISNQQYILMFYGFTEEDIAKIKAISCIFAILHLHWIFSVWFFGLIENTSNINIEKIIK